MCGEEIGMPDGACTSWCILTAARYRIVEFSLAESLLIKQVKSLLNYFTLTVSLDKDIVRLNHTPVSKGCSLRGSTTKSRH